MISIIIPTHNRIQLLKKAVSSVLAQTYKELEVLICDDGSTDDTAEQVALLAKTDSRIRYFYCGENGRPARPRNIGIENARGEWIAFLDDDDYWDANKLEQQIQAVKAYHVLACCTNANCYNLQNEETRLFFEDTKSRVYNYCDLLETNLVICSSMLVHASILKKCAGFPEQKELLVGEDYAFWLRVLCYTKIAYLADPLVFYLETSNTSIRQLSDLTSGGQHQLVMEDHKQWKKSLSFTKQSELKMKWILYVTKHKIQNYCGKVRDRLGL